MAAEDGDFDKYGPFRDILLTQLKHAIDDILDEYNNNNNNNNNNNDSNNTNNTSTNNSNSNNGNDTNSSISHSNNSESTNNNFDETNKYCLLLTICIEQCITFGMKESSLFTTRNLYEFLRAGSAQAQDPFLHNDFLSVNNVLLDKNGKARAWIRHTLNQKHLSSEIYELARDRSFLKSWFEKYSIMSTNSINDLHNLIEKIEKSPINFQYILKDSKLDDDELFGTLPAVYRSIHKLKIHDNDDEDETTDTDRGESLQPTPSQNTNDKLKTENEEKEKKFEFSSMKTNVITGNDDVSAKSNQFEMETQSLSQQREFQSETTSNDNNDNTNTNSNNNNTTNTNTKTNNESKQDTNETTNNNNNSNVINTKATPKHIPKINDIPPPAIEKLGDASFPVVDEATPEMKKATNSNDTSDNSGNNKPDIKRKKINEI